jgi:hypothetical protein
MKKYTLLTSVVVLAVSVSCVSIHAAPFAESNSGKEYIIAEEHLGNWCCGLYGQTRKRDLVSSSGWGAGYLETSSYVGYVGYDFKLWFTTYALLGKTESSIDNSSGNENNSEYGLGVVFRLLDSEILSPNLFEDKIRLNAGLQHTRSSADWMGTKTNWEETQASLTISIVNDVMSDKQYAPEAITLFLGPIYSDIKSKHFSEKDDLGFTIGMAVYLTDKVSLDISAQKFEEAGYTAGLHVRF